MNPAAEIRSASRPSAPRPGALPIERIISIQRCSSSCSAAARPGKRSPVMSGSTQSRWPPGRSSRRAWPRIAPVAGPLCTSPAPGRQRRRARRHRRQPRSRRCGAAGQSGQESARAASQVHDCGTGDDPGHVPQTGLVLEGAGRHRVVPGQLGLVKGVAVLRHAVLLFGWIVRNWAFMVGALRWTGSLRAVSGTWPASVLVAVQGILPRWPGDFMGGG
jgi:hypothetical protein